MPAVYVLLATLVFGPALLADTSAPREAPSYSAISIVNAADYQTGPLAPNTICTLFGKGLSYVTRALSGDDIHGGILPNVLPGTGVNVLIGGLAANIFYVSPTQINFLVPSILRAGHSDLQIVLNGIAGPDIPIELAAASPALFQLDGQTVIAIRADGSLITSAAAARPGDVIILFATGLGDTAPPAVYAHVATAAAQIKQIASFKLSLDGVAVDASQILYAGVAPGFAGLYQINLRIPDGVGANPQLQISLGDALSPPGLQLPVSP